MKARICAGGKEWVAPQTLTLNKSSRYEFDISFSSPGKTWKSEKLIITNANWAGVRTQNVALVTCDDPFKDQLAPVDPFEELAAATPEVERAPVSSSATINRVWLEHNVSENGRLGMRIHVAFNVNNMKGGNVALNAYFYFGNDLALNDFNQAYCTTDGKVSAGVSVTPQYEATTFNDQSIFMPYDELHVSGPEILEVIVSVFDGSTELARSFSTLFPLISASTSRSQPVSTSRSQWLSQARNPRNR